MIRARPHGVPYEGRIRLTSRDVATSRSVQQGCRTRVRLTRPQERLRGITPGSLVPVGMLRRRKTFCNMRALGEVVRVR